MLAAVVLLGFTFDVGATSSDSRPTIGLYARCLTKQLSTTYTTPCSTHQEQCISCLALGSLAVDQQSVWQHYKIAQRACDSTCKVQC